MRGRAGIAAVIGIDTDMTDTTERTFLQSDFRARSIETLIGIVIVLAFAGAVLAFFLPMMVGKEKAVPIIMASLLIAAAAYGAIKALRNDVDHCVISDRGISINDEHWPWSRVRRFYAEGWPTAPSVELKMFPKGISVQLTLQVRPKLSPAQYEELIDELKHSIGRRFPDIALGGYDVGSTV
jgi:hypothetical protein